MIITNNWGSNVNLFNVNIDNASDKGVSIGEASSVKIKNIRITHTKTAIVSKDNSKVHTSEILIENSNIGFAAYQKKSEYGPSYLFINGDSVNQAKIPYVFDKKSEIMRYNSLIKEASTKWSKNFSE